MLLKLRLFVIGLVIVFGICFCSVTFAKQKISLKDLQNNNELKITLSANLNSVSSDQTFKVFLYASKEVQQPTAADFIVDGGNIQKIYKLSKTSYGLVVEPESDAKKVLIQVEAEKMQTPKNQNNSNASNEVLVKVLGNGNPGGDEDKVLGFENQNDGGSLKSIILKILEGEDLSQTKHAESTTEIQPTTPVEEQSQKTKPQGWQGLLSGLLSGMGLGGAGKGVSDNVQNSRVASDISSVPASQTSGPISNSGGGPGDIGNEKTDKDSSKAPSSVITDSKSGDTKPVSTLSEETFKFKDTTGQESIVTKKDVEEIVKGHDPLLGIRYKGIKYDVNEIRKMKDFLEAQKGGTSVDSNVPSDKKELEAYSQQKAQELDAAVKQDGGEYQIRYSDGSIRSLSKEKYDQEVSELNDFNKKNGLAPYVSRLSTPKTESEGVVVEEIKSLEKYVLCTFKKGTTKEECDTKKLRHVVITLKDLKTGDVKKVFFSAHNVEKLKKSFPAVGDEVIFEQSNYVSIGKLVKEGVDKYEYIDPNTKDKVVVNAEKDFFAPEGIEPPLPPIKK